MLRMILLLLLIVAIIGGTTYAYILHSHNQLSLVSPSTTNSQATADVSKRLDVLETQVAFLMQRVTGQSNPNFLDNTPSVESRIANLEKTIALINQSNVPKATPSDSTSNSVIKLPPVYIPLGWTASGIGTSLDWANVSSQQMVINTSDYQGYTSMSFEANLRVYQGNGTAFARLYDVDDNTAIYLSAVSTSAQDYTWVSSPNFTLPSGKKTYQLQLKSLTGYSADVLNARIRVSF